MTVTDPVCGIQIDSEAAAAAADYEGERYYFCSENCREEFELAPEDYAEIEED
jgi:YHS domain-containing protein